MLLLNGPRITN